MNQPSAADERRATVYAVTTIGCWATAATAFKLALARLAAEQVLLIAVLTSLVVMLGAMALGGRLGQLRATPGQYARSALAGLLTPFLYYLVLFRAYALLPAQEAQPLNFVWPLVLAMLAVPVLRQRLERRTLTGLLVSFLGVVMIATRGDLLGLRIANPAGAGLALGSAVIWAVSWLLNVRDERAEEAKLALSFAFALPPVAAVCLFRTGLPTATDGLAAAVWIGLFEMGFAFLFWLRALSLSDSAARVGRLIYLVPFCSLVCIRLVLGEAILPSTLLGLVLIVGGIALGRAASAA